MADNLTPEDPSRPRTEPDTPANPYPFSKWHSAPWWTSVAGICAVFALAISVSAWWFPRPAANPPPEGPPATTGPMVPRTPQAGGSPSASPSTPAGSPRAAPRTGRSARPTSASPAPGQWRRSGSPRRIVIELTEDDKIPQRSFSLTTLWYAAAADADLVFECRSPPKTNREFNCVAADGDARTYHLFSTGAEMARVGRNALVHVGPCDGAAYVGRYESLELRTDGFYCLRTPDRRDRIMAMRVTVLPADADGPPLRIAADIGVWER